MRAPTVKQYRRLLALGSGGLIVTADRSEPVWSQLLGHGWVTNDAPGKPDRWFAARITAEGFRALATGMERYGLPQLSWGKTGAAA